MRMMTAGETRSRVRRAAGYRNIKRMDRLIVSVNNTIDGAHSIPAATLSDSIRRGVCQRMWDVRAVVVSTLLASEGEEPA